MKGFVAILRSVIRSSRRERTALIFTLLLPIFLMGLFGSIFGGSGPALKVGVVDLDRSRLSTQLIDVLRTQHGLDVEQGSIAHELDRVQHDDVVLVAVVPRGFHLHVAGAGTATIETYLDRNQLQPAALAQGAISQIVDGFAQRLSGVPCEVIAGESVIGGGSTPAQSLPTWLLAVDCDVVEAERQCRTGDPTVVARIENNRLVFDLRTVFEEEEDALANVIQRVCYARS